MTHPAEGKREQIARAIYAVSCRWIAPNFPEGHKLQTFDELGDRERRLNLEYADAALAQLSQGGNNSECRSGGALSPTQDGAKALDDRTAGDAALVTAGETALNSPAESSTRLIEIIEALIVSAEQNTDDDGNIYPHAARAIADARKFYREGA